MERLLAASPRPLEVQHPRGLGRLERVGSAGFRSLAGLAGLDFSLKALGCLPRRDSPDYDAVWEAPWGKTSVELVAGAMDWPALDPARLGGAERAPRVGESLMSFPMLELLPSRRAISSESDGAAGLLF